MKCVVMLCITLCICSCGKQHPIYIGAIGGLSGRYSELGVAGRNGVDLAIREVNEQGGINGRLVHMTSSDDRNSPEVFSEELKSLINNNVKFIIGPYTSNMANAMMKSISGRDVLVISPTISTDSVTSKDDNFLRVMTSNKSKALLTAQYINNEKHETVAVTYDVKNSAFSLSLAQQFSDEYKRLNPTVYLHIIPVNEGSERFSSIAQKVIDSGATALFNITSAIDGAELCQQLAKKRSKILIVGPIWMRTKDLIEHGGRSVEGVKFVSQYDRKVKTQKYLNFIKQYKKLFGVQPSFSSFYAYEATSILLTAMKQAKEVTPVAVKKEILTTKGYDGLQEPILFDQYGDVQRKESITKVKNGAFVLDE